MTLDRHGDLLSRFNQRIVMVETSDLLKRKLGCIKLRAQTRCQLLTVANRPCAADEGQASRQVVLPRLHRAVDVPGSELGTLGRAFSRAFATGA